MSKEPIIPALVVVLDALIARAAGDFVAGFSDGVSDRTGGDDAP